MLDNIFLGKLRLGFRWVCFKDRPIAIYGADLPRSLVLDRSAESMHPMFKVGDNSVRFKISSLSNCTAVIVGLQGVALFELTW